MRERGKPTPRRCQGDCTGVRERLWFGTFRFLSFFRPLPHTCIIIRVSERIYFSVALQVHSNSAVHLYFYLYRTTSTSQVLVFSWQKCFGYLFFGFWFLVFAWILRCFDLLCTLDNVHVVT